MQAKPPVEFLQADHDLLTEILQARRAESTETLSIGTRMLWKIYLAILEDALATINSLINYLKPEEQK